MFLNASVYTGAWTNWAHGQIRGSTFTVTAQDGGYLIAFLALFTRIAGTHLWQILCYAFFRLRSTVRPRDGLSHQQQAILRNSSSDTGALWQFILVGWHWRERTKTPYKRSLPFAIIAVLHIAAFAIAGIFSSKITVLPAGGTSRGSEVLLQSDVCGTWTTKDVTSTQDIVGETWAMTSILRHNVALASHYVSACLGTDVNITSSYECNPLGRQNIHWNATINNVCPFAPEMCANNTVLNLDSGFVYSDLHLGINSPSQDRIAYRNILKCSPLITAGYINSTYSNGTITGASFLYSKGSNETSNGTFTYEIGSFADNTPFGDLASLPPYIVQIVNSEPGARGIFDPIPQLSVPDANTVLLFLGSRAGYTTPVTDPWFNAQVPYTQMLDGTNPFIIYSRAGTDTFSVLGCADQRYFCNPQIIGSEPCIRIERADQLHDLVNTLHLSVRQASILQRLNSSFPHTQFFTAPDFLPWTLLASTYVEQLIAYGLPPNQWILELKNWFSIALAQLQLAAGQYVSAYEDVDSHKRNVSDDAAWMCHNQIAVTQGYTSFSVLGLAIVLRLGGLLIVTNLLLVSLVHLVDKGREQNQHKSIEWWADGLFQLQRLAYEGHGQGHWSGFDRNIPVTEPSEVLELSFRESGCKEELGGSSLDRGPTVSPTPSPSSIVPKSKVSVDVTHIEDGPSYEMDHLLLGTGNNRLPS